MDLALIVLLWTLAVSVALVTLMLIPLIAAKTEHIKTRTVAERRIL